MSGLPGFVNPLGDPQAWDKFEVGGTLSPGVIAPGDIQGFKRSNEWDVKKGKGTVGGQITFVQRPPAKGSITLTLWTAEQFDALAAFLPLLEYDPTKKSINAIKIYHPSLASTRITDVVTEDIGPIMHVGKGRYTITFSFLEYFPPPKSSAVRSPGFSATTNINNPTGKTPDPIGDRNDKIIEDLLKKAKEP